ncbi:DNA internalization-related competence protein ComEC/Rec2 [Telluria aromaticivorans]|uniref:DNA internalization-related competence protein ComEC/Rec2 n=1 Tax=Telluria aromaticivorans TaxID=2725995 RepID=A0A7Y2K2L9_9BURK|nr:DNA internalization-related competence protein ComEC/Rec2 [Telluria aromaticivorans]NNG25447.1 DNA internalization-related competence protein ComEC/Rec2 [Telluria aromaticivorans]
MRSASLTFLTGACLLQIAPELPAPRTILAAAAIAVLLFALRGRIINLLAAALLGATWAAFIASLALADALPRELEGKDIVVVGTVASLPHEFDGGTRFNFEVERVLTPEATIPQRIALSWYGRMTGPAGAAQVEPGERWRLVVRLQRPHGNANPHGFDYEAWLLEQGVRATGYVRPAGSANRRLDGFVPSVGHLVERARAALRRHIGTELEGKRYAGVIVALVIGDQRGIDQSDWDVFNRTGISHLVSISGLHVTMVAGLAAWAVSALWRRSFFVDGAALPLVLPAQKAAAVAGALAALLYVLLAGFGVPAQRTFYMLAAVAFALWTGRIATLSQVLCLALAVVVIIDPWAVLSAGFWLSFGAVAVILYANLGRVQPAKGWRRSLRMAAQTQYAVTVGLVPLTLFLFSQVSIVSPLANAVAIPVVSLVVTPLALAGALLPAPLAGWVLGLAHLLVDWLAHAMAWLAAGPLAVWSAPAPQPWILALALAGTAWMLAPLGWPHRWAGLAAWAPMLTQLSTTPDGGSFTVTAFDVGQGMALLVETNGHRLLYDAGPQYAPGADAAGRIILPYLRGRGIRALDALVVSHSDTDHAGGARTLLQGMEVASVHSSLAAAHPVVQEARSHTRCTAGQEWSWDGVRFEMLGPAPGSYADAGLKANARSCVLRVSASGKAIVLAGDIEAAQEAQLVQQRPASLRADVLLAPHHGSGTSSTTGFLAAVNPGIGIFQVGYRNRYRHPKREVYERYRARGIRRIRTDEAGAVTISFGSSIELTEYRASHPRYWYGR